MVILVIGIVIVFAIMDRFKRMFDYQLELKAQIDRINAELYEIKQKINE